MNYTLKYNLRLLPRNEGKIKSYESCCDLRAWSHDVSAKDRYLREWMRGDMPVYVIPVSTLTNFMKTMTCRSHRRVAPRCHPDCKSKVLVESICNSCHAIRECFEVNDFEKYFVEEELETSQWPCDRCLDALKSIKMFWKIIVDKIFHVNISKYEEANTKQSCDRDCVRTVARRWQSDIVSQAFYVKNINTPVLGGLTWSNKVAKRYGTSHHSAKSWPVEDKLYTEKKTRQANAARLQKFREEKERNLKGIRKKLDRGTHAAAKLTSKGCDTCFSETKQDEVDEYKKNIELLQMKYSERDDEVDRLKRENQSLRIELENVYTSCPWKDSFYYPSHGSQTFHHQPYEIEDKCTDPVNKLDSEMIITMKQCKHENFKHVSMLQVLHKSNDPKIDANAPCCNKNDPIDILKKVQTTFGAMVQRELGILNIDRRQRTKKPLSEVEANFHSVNSSRSAPSCSTLSSRLSSERLFMTPTN